MADALRRSMDAAAYKHVVLGLIFLKYILDASEEAHARQLTICCGYPQEYGGDGRSIAYGRFRRTALSCGVGR